MDIENIKSEFKIWANRKSTPAYTVGWHSSDVFDFLEERFSKKAVCDCQDYENGFVSNYCPVHNERPYSQNT